MLTALVECRLGVTLLEQGASRMRRAEGVMKMM
jgi:hypothetical protein